MKINLGGFNLLEDIFWKFILRKVLNYNYEFNNYIY